MSKEHTELEALFEEITRYLAAVDVFRAASCEPTWRPELPCAIAPPRADVSLSLPSDVSLH